MFDECHLSHQTFYPYKILFSLAKSIDYLIESIIEEEYPPAQSVPSPTFTPLSLNLRTLQNPDFKAQFEFGQCEIPAPVWLNICSSSLLRWTPCAIIVVFPSKPVSSYTPV